MTHISKTCLDIPKEQRAFVERKQESKNLPQFNVNLGQLPKKAKQDCIK